MKYRNYRDVAGTCLVVLLVASSMLVTSSALAQARGPAVNEIQRNGQPIVQASRLRDLAGQFEMARQQQQRLELRSNPDLLAAQLARADEFLQRLPGRFLIEGRIEETRWVSIPADNAAMQSGPAQIQLHKNIRGSAVCARGAGAGIQCSIDAEWLPLAARDGVRSVRVNSRSVEPTLLSLSVDAQSAQIRTELTAAAKVAEQWTASLNDAKAKSVRVVSCGSQRCFDSLEVSTEPDGGGVSIVIRDRRFTIHLTMIREPATT